MKQFNVHEAKTQLSAILGLVVSGEEVIIAKAGKPVAALSPYRTPNAEREFGPFRGAFQVSDISLEPMDEEFMSHF